MRGVSCAGDAGYHLGVALEGCWVGRALHWMMGLAPGRPSALWSHCRVVPVGCGGRRPGAGAGRASRTVLGPQWRLSACLRPCSPGEAAALRSGTS